MARYALHEILTAKQAALLPSGTVVSINNVSPGAWLNANPRYAAILDALEARAPLGWEHVQLDSVCRYDLHISDLTAQQMRDERARSQG